MTIRKFILAIMTGLFLVSTGAMAADTHKCKKGKVWDADKKHCVVEKK
ncbi:MAG TPA: hypothetical protein VMH34_00710 [Gammaproteobacteria bacterium]|nr:hypothetical protein [Gammaproteobacteria bacterium]